MIVDSPAYGKQRVMSNFTGGWVCSHVTTSGVYPLSLRPTLGKKILYVSFESEMFHNDQLTRVKGLAWQDSITSSKILLCVSNRECNDTTVSLCFQKSIYQMVSFQQERKLNWSTGAHMFFIGLQCKNLGQGLVRPTLHLTSALTLRLVTGLCIHTFQCSRSVATEPDPLG